MKKLFLSTLLLALPLLASAYDIAVENEDGVTIYYNYINNGKELEVTNNNGWGNSYSGIILIPEEVTYKNVTRKVTSVGEYAFKDCEKTISVTLPNSVITISPYAFIGCTGLISITMGEGISFIGYKAFSNCTNLSSVAIPNCVVTLGNSSFADCGSLSSITIGNSVTTIGGSAFLNCNSLTSISIPNSVKEIEMYAFSGCSGLTSIISEIENPCPISETCFSEEIFNNTLLYVPKGTTEKYKSTDYWNKFLHIIEGSPFEHTLTYLVDGETYSTYTLEEGDEITPDEAPTKEGYTFSGWSEIPETMPASDFTITGSFTINKYKLTYTLDGEEYKTVEVDYGTAITPEEAPVKEGYTFSGWSVIPATMPAGDVTITGSFSVNKYNLTYKVDGVDYKTA